MADSICTDGRSERRAARGAPAKRGASPDTAGGAFGPTDIGGFAIDRGGMEPRFGQVQANVLA